MKENFQGKVKALADSTPQRFPMLPQVPTVAESAVPGFDVNFFYGIAAPAKVQPGVVARVREAIRAITALPDVRARMSPDVQSGLLQAFLTDLPRDGAVRAK